MTRQKRLQNDEIALWHSGSRLFLVAIMLLSGAYATFLGPQDAKEIPRLLYLLIAVGFVASGLSALWLRSHTASRSFLVTQFALDAIMITGVVYITGCAVSPFSFLYLPLVMIATVAVSRAAAFLVASMSIGAYLGLMWGLRNGLIESPDASGLIELPSTGLLLQTVGLASAMFLVAVATHFLRTRLEASNDLVEKSNAELRAIESEQTTLLKDLRQAEAQLKSHDDMAKRLTDDAAFFDESSPFAEFVGTSAVMEKVFGIIRRVAKSEATILVTGESGTGKELVARAVHSLSDKTHKPFVPVNCGAIPETLIESELFGHKKGAFTGADNDSVGLVRQADGGTLFLDEIGELPLLMQTKLLRTIQDKRVRPVGSSTDIPVNVRIVAATNRNLKREVTDGRFREDLYYRLNVIGIHLPPLRERHGDLPLLITAILKRLCGRTIVIPVLPPATMKLLLEYRYPGNVRELENILERAVVLGGDAILPEHLPDLISSPTGPELHFTEITAGTELHLPVDLDKILQDIERRHLEAALLEAGGLKKRAAELLGMNFRSFRYRLKKYELASETGIEPSENHTSIN